MSTGVRHELGVAAAGGRPRREALADRLTAPLDSAHPPGTARSSVRRGAGDHPRTGAPVGRCPTARPRPGVHRQPGGEDEPEPVAAVPEADDDGGTWRVTLRMPESLRSPVDAAARAEGLSVNAWLVRAVASALGGRRHARANTDKHFSGWVR